MQTIYRRHTTSCEHYGKSRNAAATAKVRNLKASSLTKFREVIERRFLEFCVLGNLRIITDVDVETIRDFRSTVIDGRHCA